MVKLPDGFVATKYPGYFWNIPEQKLYSIKIRGVLRPLKLVKASTIEFFINRRGYKNPIHSDGYQVSVNGHQRYLFVNDLNKLKEEDSVVPVEK